MTSKHFLLWPFAAAAVLVYTGMVAAGAEHEHAVKIGRTGEISFEKEARIGALTLQPGRYKFQHRVEGADHFVHFTEWTQRLPGDQSYPPASLSGPKAHLGEVKCRVQFLNKKVADTTLYMSTEGDAMRVTKIEVGGENVAHLF
jgi:hypothetical protein